MLALILLGLMTLSALAWPIYYIRVARPWRNPIGRLMLAQAAVVLLYVSRSWYSLLNAQRALADPSPFGIITGILLIILLASFIPVYEYVRKKELNKHDRT